MKFKLVNSDYSNLDDYQEVLDQYDVKVTDTGEESFMGGTIKRYEINVTSLKELMSFVKDIGRPVIVINDEDERKLEIYDYWRE